MPTFYVSHPLYQTKTLSEFHEYGVIKRERNTALLRLQMFRTSTTISISYIYNCQIKTFVHQA